MNHYRLTSWQQKFLNIFCKSIASESYQTNPHPFVWPHDQNENQWESSHSVLAWLLNVMMLRFLVSVSIEVFPWKWLDVKGVNGFFGKIAIRFVVRWSGHFFRCWTEKKNDVDQSKWIIASIEKSSWVFSASCQQMDPIQLYLTSYLSAHTSSPPLPITIKFL